MRPAQIDAFLVYVAATGVVQVIYCGLVGTFPFNSFLAGFMSCIGMFVLTGEQHWIHSVFSFLCLDQGFRS